MKQINSILMLLLLSMFSYAQTATEPSGGNGTESAPYQIENLENLYWLSQNSSFWDAHYIQTADIDASETENWYSGEGFPPIGTEAEPFTGSYDGNGHLISNLHIARASDYVALFGVLGTSDSPAEIKNLGIENASITVSSHNGYWCAAPLAGWMDFGDIDNCFASGEVNGEEFSAGLVAFLDIGSVKNSYSNCTVTGTSLTGGVAAIADYAENCYATGDITGTEYVGGFAGYSDRGINQCYSTGNVSGSLNVGGFVGQMHNASTDPFINDCYAWGNVTRVSGSTSESFGGFLGLNDDNGRDPNILTNSYSIGSVVYEDAENPTDKGFVGEEIGTHTYSGNFYNYSTSGQESGTGASKKLNSGMQTLSTFTDAGWDFMGETTNGEDDYWGINENENNGYPFFAWQGYKMQTDVNEWPTFSVLECGQSLSDVDLTGGDASTSGTFGFANPDSIPPLGSSEQELQFIPADTGTYETVSSQKQVNVEDTQGPVPELSELPDITAECEVTELVPPTATDSCAGEIEGTHDADLPILDQGTHTVTWTYEDEAGNTSTQTQEVVIEDVTSPTITCVENQTVNPNQSETYYTVQGSEFDPTDTDDNCEVATVENDYNNKETLAGEEISIGTTTIKWTVSDETGNTADCSFDVTVNEVVGISDVSTADIYIYPNPTNGILTIDFSSYGGQENIKRIEISDNSGKAIYSTDKARLISTIDISNQPSGIYIIKIRTEKEVFTAKIIKK